MISCLKKLYIILDIVDMYHQLISYNLNHIKLVHKIKNEGLETCKQGIQFCQGYYLGQRHLREYQLDNTLSFDVDLNS